MALEGTPSSIHNLQRNQDGSQLLVSQSLGASWVPTRTWG